MVPFLNRIVKTWLLFVLLSCTADNTKKELTLSGKVIGVKDGDTIEILYDGKPLIIRLAHIDCPEIRKGQPFGKAAKLLTSELCFGQTATVVHDGEYDQYKRLIATIINEKKENVNKALVKAGLAWHFTKYSSNKAYAQLELEARQNRIGLWADNNPTPPWKWRKK